MGYKVLDNITGIYKMKLILWLLKVFLPRIYFTSFQNDKIITNKFVSITKMQVGTSIIFLSIFFSFIDLIIYFSNFKCE